MKQFFWVLLIIIFFTNCNNNPKNTEDKKDSAVKETTNAVISNSPLLGSFVGAFGNNKITLLITKIFGDSIEGNSIVSGNNRPFSGIAKATNGIYNIIGKEPGGDKHDGIFTLSFDEKNNTTITGNWKPYKEDSTIKAKDFSLTRNAFKYLVDVGEYPQASKRLLTEEDVNNLSVDGLNVMRNEIFARHGYCFKKKDLRQIFEDKDWYIPNTIDIKNDLTEIEKKNIVLIKKYEKYAEENGDDFGR